MNKVLKTMIVAASVCSMHAQAQNTVSGRFFIDNDGDSLQSTGDGNKVTATVVLLKGNNVVAGTVTDANGNYTFSGFANGWHRVRFIRDFGDTFVTGNLGSDDTIDSDVWTQTGVVNSATSAFNFTGNTSLVLDGGISESGSNPPGGNSVSGRFYNDNDDNNVQSAGDTDVVGATVELLKGSNVVATTITDSAGDYLISGFGDGWHKVRFTKPTGATFVSGNFGNDDTIDSDVTQPASGSTSASNYTGTTNLVLDAGITGGSAPNPMPQPNPVPGGNTVTGRFYIDNDESNVQTAGDTNVVGATVELLKGSTVVATTTTLSTGEYTISGFGNGWHKVRFTKPTDTTFVSGNFGNDDTIDSDVTQLASGSTSASNYTGSTTLDLDAGIIPPADPGAGNTITGYAFIDNDDSDTQTTGDNDFANVTIELISLPDTVVATTTTDASGNYTFTGFSDGYHKVRFYVPAGYKFVKSKQHDPAIDSDHNTTGSTVSGTSSAFDFNGDFSVDLDVGFELLP